MDVFILGAKEGDRSPSTAGVSGHYNGEICSAAPMATPHGYGIMTWDNDITYEGSWKDGLFHGEF